MLLLGLWMEKMRPLLLSKATEDDLAAIISLSSLSSPAAAPSSPSSPSDWHKTTGIHLVALAVCDIDRAERLLLLKRTGMLGFTTLVIVGDVSPADRIHNEAAQHGVVVLPLALLFASGISDESGVAAVSTAPAGEASRRGAMADESECAVAVVTAVQDNRGRSLFARARIVSHEEFFADLWGEQAATARDTCMAWVSDCSVIFPNTDCPLQEVQTLVTCIHTTSRCALVQPNCTVTCTRTRECSERLDSHLLMPRVSCASFSLLTRLGGTLLLPGWALYPRCAQACWMVRCSRRHWTTLDCSHPRSAIRPPFPHQADVHPP